MINTWAQILATTVQRMWIDIVSIIPSILVAIVLLLLGWIVGGGLAKIVAQLVDTLKIDAALRSAGVDKVVDKTGYKMNAGGFLGGLVKWFVIAIFLVAALEVLKLTQVTAFLSQIVFFYMPQVIVAVLILLIAAVLADFTSNLVVGAAKAADIGSPYFVGSVARWAIWIFAILAALDHFFVTPPSTTALTVTAAFTSTGTVITQFSPGGNVNRLRVDGGGGNATLALAPIPEPDTYGMLLAGLGLFGFIARRKAKREVA